MNFVKRNYKIVVYITFTIIFIGIGTFFIFYKGKEKINFLTVMYDYVICSNEDKISFNTIVYANESSCEYLKKDNITECYLSSSDNNNRFIIKIDEIKQTNKVDYEKETYFAYEMALTLPFAFNNQLHLENAFLEFNYDNGEIINLKLGSMCLYNSNDNNEVTYGSLTPITMKDGNNVLLSGVIIQLHSKDNINIKEIEAISNYSVVNNELCKVLSSEEDINKVKEMLTTNYNIKEISDNDSLNLYDIKEDNKILIALSNQTGYVDETIGFILTYEINNVIKQKVIYPFRFYDTHKTLEIEKHIYECSKN